jgi:UDP-glucose 4-epimerase
MSKIIVTGGAGFIGSHVVDKLIDNGHQVFVWDNLITGNQENINPKSKFVKIDIKNSKEVERSLDRIKPEIIFHLAAQINVRESLENPLEDAKNNILGSLNIFRSAGKNGIERIIYSSTGGAVYGDPKELPCKEGSPIDPLCPYGVSKYGAENYLKMFSKLQDFKFIILRYANVYGPRQDPKGEAGVISVFADQLLNNKQPYINGDGEQTRDFVCVEDVAEANLKASQTKSTNEIFNIGTGKPTSIKKLYNIIQKAASSTTEAKHNQAIPGEVKDSYLDIGKAKKTLNWQPKYQLSQGIKRTVNWIKKQR